MAFAVLPHCFTGKVATDCGDDMRAHNTISEIMAAFDHIQQDEMT